MKFKANIMMGQRPMLETYTISQCNNNKCIFKWVQMKNIYQNEFEGNQKKNTTSATTTATPKNTNRNRFQCSHANPHIKRINATKYALRHYANAVRCPIRINLFSIHIVSSLYGHDYAVQINIIFWMLLLALFSRCLSRLIHLHKLLKILCDYYDFFVFVFVFLGMDFFSVSFFSSKPEPNLLL